MCMEGELGEGWGKAYPTGLEYIVIQRERFRATCTADGCSSCEQDTEARQLANCSARTLCLLCGTTLRVHQMGVALKLPGRLVAGLAWVATTCDLTLAILLDCFLSRNVSYSCIGLSLGQLPWRSAV